ncbi:MAG: GTPase HflX [Candidatus Omnitrophica bacterium]|nr:GTPase HflX [Candidatus Omnitrophota bacterium]
MERALSVTVDFGRREAWSAEERSSELSELIRSAGAKVAKEVIVRRHEPSPACFIGEGKVQELAGVCADEHINVVVFNNDLTGTQQKNLEDTLRTKTIDRTQLILDIFARRAHSNEGKIQVELAQLMYLLPRLTGKGIYLSRLGGGIGTRGPGEQKLEVDRRRIRSKIASLENHLDELSRRREMMRKKREKFSVLTIALIGYTNVGKSTLLNALTDSKVIVEDKLFSTLDPTVRRFVMPNKQRVLFADTVGFLDRIPHHLVEAFKATLEEVAQADLILHLVDASHAKAEEQASAAYKVLNDIGAKDVPMLTVLNKIDKLEDPVIVERAKKKFNTNVAISALKRKGFDVLIKEILPHIKSVMSTVKLTIPASDVGTTALLYENGLVTKKEYRDDKVYIEAEVPVRIKEMLKKKY